MVGNSRRVVNAQSTPHAALVRQVHRHRSTGFRRPLAAHTVAAFAALAEHIDPQRPLVLDSGCGTGESSLRLAARHPNAQVIGVDKSAHRLARAPGNEPGEVRFVRADLRDFWRLAREAGWFLAAHYLFYPTPWPKTAHLQRRWHGHPVFPELLALGGSFELRTNWSVYAEEFTIALELCGFAARVEALPMSCDGEPVSPFERKYLASGQRCLRVTADLGAAGGVDPCCRRAVS